jgi:hypothetical protein
VYRVISGINLGAGTEFKDGYSLFLEQVSDSVKLFRLDYMRHVLVHRGSETASRKFTWPSGP